MLIIFEAVVQHDLWQLPFRKSSQAHQYFRDDHMRKRTFSQLLLNIHTSNLNVTMRWVTNSFFVLLTMISVYEKCALFSTLLRLKRKYIFIISCSWGWPCHSGISRSLTHMKFVEHCVKLYEKNYKNELKMWRTEISEKIAIHTYPIHGD